MKMNNCRKYVFPIALAKIALCFLVLHFFCTSCSQDNLLYTSDKYSDGPLVEIEASFGDSITHFTVNDTIYLTIDIDSPVFIDQLTYASVDLNDAFYSCVFWVKDESGNAVDFTPIENYDNIEKVSDGCYKASFGNVNYQNISKTYGEVHLKLGITIDLPGDYIFYFENTPNTYVYDGEVDILYNFSASDSTHVNYAYAFYLFDVDNHSLEYAGDSNSDGYLYRTKILSTAGFDQGIKEFTVED